MMNSFTEATYIKTKALLEMSSLDNFDVILQILENIGSAVAILNSNRDIAFANSAFSAMVHNSDLSSILGLKLGQTFDCIHLAQGLPCGQNPDCLLCGANLAILDTYTDARNTRECRILRKSTNEALDLEVTSSKVQISSQHFFLITINDISHKERRRSLERIFFHDILNGVSSLQMATELMEKIDDKKDYFVSEMKHILKRMLSDINSQRLLTSAEERELKTNKDSFSLDMLLEDLVPEFQTMAEDKNCSFTLSNKHTIEFHTDYSLLSRVLINAVKNAVEASFENTTINCKIDIDSQNNIIFAIHNASVIPLQYRNQIFKRSFSTKGQDRGLGTYSIKILIENYLQGRVWFTSTEEEGTTFYLLVPPTCL